MAVGARTFVSKRGPRALLTCILAGFEHGVEIGRAWEGLTVWRKADARQETTPAEAMSWLAACARVSLP